VAKDATVRQALDGFLPESHKVIQGTMEDLDKRPRSLYSPQLVEKPSEKG
jgi:hypothetical protein